MRSKASRLTISVFRSPRGAMAPRLTPKFSSGSGCISLPFDGSRAYKAEMTARVLTVLGDAFQLPRQHDASLILVNG